MTAIHEGTSPILDEAQRTDIRKFIEQADGRAAEWLRQYPDGTHIPSHFEAEGLFIQAALCRAVVELSERLADIEAKLEQQNTKKRS